MPIADHVQNITCYHCKLIKPRKEYYPSRLKYTARGKMSLCAVCCKHFHKQTREKHRAVISKRRSQQGKTRRARYHRVKRKFGIGDEEYRLLELKQGGGCAICARSLESMGRWPAVDHDHKTGKVRGLLCGSCNRGLGLYADSSLLLRKAADYIDNSGMPW